MGEYISAPPLKTSLIATLLSLHATLVCRCRCPSASGLGELWRHVLGVALGGDPLEGLAAGEREAHARDHDEGALHAEEERRDELEEEDTCPQLAGGAQLEEHPRGEEPYGDARDGGHGPG